MHSRRFLCAVWIAGIEIIASYAGDLPHFSDDVNLQILTHQLVEAMDDREVLGQMLMFGYVGELPDKNIIHWITEGHLGAVKIFGKNANNLSLLTKTVTAYQKAALSVRLGIPLLIATDQEGGWVRHIKGKSSITPGNMALGADPVPGDALEIGRIIGRELAAVGVNMNFAPTVDVFVDPKADVIGPRAFMNNPHWTGILSLAFAKGQEESGVISTAKHFPGHGDTSDDSHGTLPVVYAGIETLRKRDLVPYRMMIQAGLPAIMAGHLAFPLVTQNNEPATLSKFILTDLLRGEIGFEGVVVTDDLFMRGARIDNAPLHQVCYRAILAGADLLLVSQNPQAFREIYDRLNREMTTNPTFKARVRESTHRIVKMKLEWLKGPKSVPFFPESFEEAFSDSSSQAFILTQAARSITLVRDGRFPIKAEDAGRVLLAGAYPNFFIEGQRRYPGAQTWKLATEGTVNVLRQRGRALSRAAARYDTVIVLLQDAGTAILLDELEKIAERVVVISVLSPAHLDELEWAQTTIAAYGVGKESFQAVFAALAGDFEPEGKLPIPLESTP